MRVLSVSSASIWLPCIASCALLVLALALGEITGAERNGSRSDPEITRELVIAELQSARAHASAYEALLVGLDALIRLELDRLVASTSDEEARLVRNRLKVLRQRHDDVWRRLERLLPRRTHCELTRGQVSETCRSNPFATGCM